MAKGTTSKMWRRTTIILILLIVAGFGTVVFSLIKLQLINGESLKSQAVENQLKDTTIVAQRGTIYDSNMKVLAQSATVWKVVLAPAQLYSDSTAQMTAEQKAEHQKVIESQKSAIAECLHQAVGLDQKTVMNILNTKKNSYWEVAATKVETDAKNKILDYEEKYYQSTGKKYSISGVISLVEDYKRYYPYGDFASQVLGFTNNDGTGVEGLEAEYNSRLAGVNGRIIAAKSATQTDMPFQYQQKIKAQDGSSLVLTIDEVVQHTLEKYLEEGAELNKVGNRACGILMNVKTGEILGMATRGGFDSSDILAESVAQTGDFDPNNPRVLTDAEKASIAKLPKDQQSAATLAALQQKWRNKCVSDTYMPGSVFKMVTASMGLEEGIVTESMPFYDPGYIDVEGTRIHCWKSGGHGAETFEQAVMNSCNPQFAYLGLKLGNRTFFKYFEAFGFTKATGIDLPGEPTNYSYYKAEDLNKVSLAVEAFGQNFKITPVQMITACAAVANGGYLVQPHIVKQIIDSEGNIVQTTSTTTKRQVISTDTSKRVAAMLEKDAVAGTAVNGYVPGYRVAGKTGTSEKIDKDNKYKAKVKNGEEKKYYIASYCGFAPADDPQYALLVFCDEPNGASYYGNAVSGPIFNKVMREVLPYLGVEPKYTTEEQQQLDVKTPDVTGKSLQQAKSAVSSATGELKIRIYGDGDTVVSQLPAAGSNIPRQGTVAVFTNSDSQSETVEVPNFVGDGTNSISMVESLAADAGLNISISGVSTGNSTTTAVATTQSVDAGQKVTPGTVIDVTFAEQGDSG